jgi:hypothetical protein
LERRAATLHSIDTNGALLVVQKHNHPGFDSIFVSKNPGVAFLLASAAYTRVNGQDDSPAAAWKAEALLRSVGDAARTEIWAETKV